VKIISWSQLELILVAFCYDPLVPWLCRGTPCLPDAVLAFPARAWEREANLQRLTTDS